MVQLVSISLVNHQNSKIISNHQKRDSEHLASLALLTVNDIKQKCQINITKHGGSELRYYNNIKIRIIITMVN